MKYACIEAHFPTMKVTWCRDSLVAVVRTTRLLLRSSPRGLNNGLQIVIDDIKNMVLKGFPQYAWSIGLLSNTNEDLRWQISDHTRLWSVHPVVCICEHEVQYDLW